MNESVGHSEQDVRIIAALLAHPRARIRALAAAAMTSEPTVSRRLNALLGDGMVRVVGVTDQQRIDAGFAVFLRLRCVPGTSLDVARTVAQWPEAGYVSVIGGDLDCAAQVHVTSTAHLLEITNHRLSTVPGVTGSFTSKIIRRFSTPHGWTGGLLPEHSLTLLRSERLDHWSENRPYQRRLLDRTDHALVSALAQDGRCTWHELGGRLHMQPATARRRVESLMSAGILRMRTVVQPATLGQPVVAFVWLRVAPSRLKAAGRALAEHPNVLNIAATTGTANLSGEVAVSSDDALTSFIIDDVGQLPGVGSVDISDGLAVIKRAAHVFDPDPAEQAGR